MVDFWSVLFLDFICVAKQLSCAHDCLVILSLEQIFIFSNFTESHRIEVSLKWAGPVGKARIISRTDVEKCLSQILEPS